MFEKNSVLTPLCFQFSHECKPQTGSWQCRQRKERTLSAISILASWFCWENFFFFSSFRKHFVSPTNISFPSLQPSHGLFPLYTRSDGLCWGSHYFLISAMSIWPILWRSLAVGELLVVFTSWKVITVFLLPMSLPVIFHDSHSL